MSAIVTVTLTVGTPCDYWVSPKAMEGVTGLGVVAPPIVHGSIAPDATGTPVTLTMTLDNGFAWNVALDFRNAPPVYFEGFQPGSGGDLLTLLAAQGWQAL